MRGASTKRIGDRGEEIAREYLGRHGFEILAANFRFGRKEIDLIAFGEGFIVFIEVKLRRGRGFGHPAEAVDGRKQAAILACARAFLHAHRCDNRACRFDVVSIEFDESGEPAIEHIRNAFPSVRS
jgi:putative endonuclease